jgi:hypothetical protein
MVTHPDSGNGPVDRIPLTGRLTVTIRPGVSDGFSNRLI